MRQPTERGQPPGDEQHARARSDPERCDRPPEPCGRDRGERHDRHGEPRLQRTEPPAVDQQDHEQEERRDEASGDEQERRVRADVRASGGLGYGHGVRAAQRDQREQDDRRLHEEDRLPTQQLGEDPADGGPERGADDPGERPDASRACLRSCSLAQEVERRADDGGPCDTLKRATCDEHTERRREAAEK